MTGLETISMKTVEKGVDGKSLKGDAEKLLKEIGGVNDAVKLPKEIVEETKDIKQEIEGKLGGSYKDVFVPGEGSTTEVHHIPANEVNGLDLNEGPAIKMDKADHRQTASCGNSKEARAYREQQKNLIDNGKFDDALQMDIDDIHEKFEDKYDEGITQVKQYVEELKEEGKI